MDLVYRLLAYASGMEVSVKHAAWLAFLVILSVIAIAILQAVPPLVAAYAMRKTKAKYYYYKGLTMRKDRPDED